MFYFNCFGQDPNGIAGTISIKKQNDPRGKPNVINDKLTDINGKIWFLQGQVGDKVLARPLEQYDLLDRNNINDSSTAFCESRIVSYRTYNIKIVK